VRVWAERRDQDWPYGQAEPEGPVTPEDVAELRADKHERRHHDVHRDRACTPVTVVFRSATICEIETFITLESSTMMNWAAARIPRQPLAHPLTLGLAADRDAFAT
jgi:hypothetical protein